MTITASDALAKIGRSEAWGYVVWGGMGLVIAVPELSAVFDNKVPWPTISGMTGHLEYRWSAVALIVVALIVYAGYHAVRYPWTTNGGPGPVATRGRLRRTDGGRFTIAHQATSGDDEAARSVLWLLAALAAVVGGTLLAAALHPHGGFFLGYVLYGLIAVFWIVIPNALAFWFAKDVAFPTLFLTIDYLERRFHVAVLVLFIGLVILLLHLALYPWPDIFRQLQRPSPNSL